MDAAGKLWLKLTYVDGVNPLFFLQSMGQRRPQIFVPGVGEQDIPGRVLAFRRGGLAALQGDAQGVDFIALGKVSDDEILDLVESAL